MDRLAGLEPGPRRQLVGAQQRFPACPRACAPTVAAALARRRRSPAPRPRSSRPCPSAPRRPCSAHPPPPPAPSAPRPEWATSAATCAGLRCTAASWSIPSSSRTLSPLAWLMAFSHAFAPSRNDCLYRLFRQFVIRQPDRCARNLAVPTRRGRQPRAAALHRAVRRREESLAVSGAANGCP